MDICACDSFVSEADLRWSQEYVGQRIMMQSTYTAADTVLPF